MDIKVLFFARSRELAGVSEAVVTIPAGATSLTLLNDLMAKYPKLEEIKGAFVLALNQEYLGVDDEVPLKAGDEVAVIPPISGG